MGEAGRGQERDGFTAGAIVTGGVIWAVRLREVGRACRCEASCISLLELVEFSLHLDNWIRTEIRTRRPSVARASERPRFAPVSRAITFFNKHDAGGGGFLRRPEGFQRGNPIWIQFMERACVVNYP